VVFSKRVPKGTRKGNAPNVSLSENTEQLEGKKVPLSKDCGERGGMPQVRRKGRQECNQQAPTGQRRASHSAKKDIEKKNYRTGRRRKLPDIMAGSPPLRPGKIQKRNKGSQSF